MADNETAVQEQNQDQAATAEASEEQAYQYQIKIEDAGPATKKVHVEVPQERIAEILADQFKTLRREANIPGFRVGHAPQKLVEKRFSSDVREQVRRTLISESYEQAVQKNSLNVIGEPEFDNPDDVKLPESGSLHYSFSVEVQPEIVLPPLVGLNVKKPKVDLTEEHIDQALNNLRQQNGGALVPVEDRGVEAGDYLVADVHVKHDGNVVAHQHDAQLVARKGRLEGIEIDDLAEKLAGLKPGEKREIAAHAPANHANEALRDKDVQIEVALKDIKKLELPEVNEQFLDSLGFTNVQELRDALKERMVEQLGYDVQQAMREQINNYLLQQITLEIPAKLSERQAARLAQRRAVDLMMRGMSREQVAENISHLREGAKEEAARELKLFFILQQVASLQNVDVSESELNSRVATLAMQRGRRPEKMKQEMSKDGTLANLYVQMREQKALDKILETATIEEVDPKALEEKQGEHKHGEQNQPDKQIEQTEQK